MHMIITVYAFCNKSWLFLLQLPVGKIETRFVLWLKVIVIVLNKLIAKFIAHFGVKFDYTLYVIFSVKGRFLLNQFRLNLTFDCARQRWAT